MTPVTPEDKERFMPLLASPLGGFMPLLIIFIVLIGFTLWQGKRQVKKRQAIVRPAGDEEEFAFADDVPTENSTVHDDVATESANDVLTSPEASAVNAHTSDEQPQA